MNRADIEQKILKSIPRQKRVRLHLAPRFGKTKLMIQVIQRDDPQKILWVTPSRHLADNDIPNEFKKWNAEEYLPKLEVTTWSALKNHTGKYDLIVLDEEQFATEANCHQILKSALKGRIITMTGTPSTREDKNDLYRAMRMQVAYQLSIDEAVALGIISDYNITVFYVQMDETQNIEKESKGQVFYTSEAEHYQRMNRKATSFYGGSHNTIPWAIAERTRLIKSSPTKKELAKRIIYHKCTGRSLIFSPFIDYAEALCPATYHSKSESKIALEKFQAGAIKQLAIVNAGAVGFTFRGIEQLLIVQMDSNKTGLSTQKISRALLKEENKSVEIYVLCLRDTQDEKWVREGLKEFDSTKIKYIQANLT